MGRSPRGNTRARLVAVMQAANRSYGHRHGVLGVGVGTKFKQGAPLKGTTVIHFYVQEKKELSALTRPRLPRYMHLRNANGVVDRSSRIPTDVIEVGRISAACVAGETVRSLNDAGAITLLFRNKNQRDPLSTYVLTCSHVVGDLRSSPPNPDNVDADCDAEHNPFARTVFSGTPSGVKMAFDVALARVAPNVPPQPDCLLNTEPRKRVTGWQTPSALGLPHQVACLLPASGTTTANIQSFLGSVRVQYRLGEIEVGNAYLIDIPVQPGDSGGVLYSGETIVGMVFARSESSFGWCHLVSESIGHINASSNLAVTPF